MPSEEEWKNLKANIEHSKYMLYEDTPTQQITDKLKELGVTVIVFRTACNTPPSNDFLQAMKNNIKNLQQALKP